MDVIYFKDEQDFYDKTIYLSKGGEAELRRFNYNGRELLIKDYYDISSVKIDKIKLVGSIENDNLLKPEFLVSINDKIYGYAMEFKKGFYPISVMKKDLSELEIYNLLLKIKNIIFDLRAKGCLYADLNVNNIITDGENVYLADALNVQISSYSFEAKSKPMNDYFISNDTLDGVENYLLNLLTIYMFNEIEYDDIISNITLTLENVFNKNNYMDIKSLTDNIECMDIGYDMIATKKTNKLLMDYMNIEKTKTI